MDACPVTDWIMVGTRALVYLICTLTGPYAIRLGVRMYQQAITSKSSGEVTGMGFKLVLKSAGPGLFLIAFGVGLLAFIVSRPVRLEDTSGPVSRPSPAQWESDARPPVLLKVQAAGAPLAPVVSPSDRDRCAIRTRVRVFASGTDPLSQDAIVANLTAAAAGLRMAGASGIADPLVRADVVNGLDALRIAAETE